MTTAPTGPSGPAGPGPGRDLTGPTQPTPAPLPNPGPPPTPRGHLPIGADMSPWLRDKLPSLDMVVRDADRMAVDLLALLTREYDVESAPSAEDDPTGLGYVEIRLLSARADARSLLKMLEQIAALQNSARRTSASLPGGPFNHPVRRPDEGLTPGLDAGAGHAPEGSGEALSGASAAGSNHLARNSPRVSGGLLPGLADATVSPTAGGTGESNTTRFGRDAGESSGPWEMNAAQLPVSCAGATPATGAGPNSDPGRRLSQRAPVGNGVTPGVGFTVPSAKSWMWSA